MIKDIELDSNGNSFSFKGNFKLRGENIPLSYTQEHIREFKRCSEDIIYFIENYCTIMDPDIGLTVPKLYPWQKDLLLTIKNNKKTIVMIPRQSGKSVSLSMFMTWFSLFNNDKVSCVVAQKEKIAKEVFKRVQTSILLCPQFLKPGVKEWSKTSLELDNGSRVICAATTPDGISGFTINGICLIDEASKIRPSLFGEFFTAMEPTIAAADSSKLVLVSTPKGCNHFYRMWKGAEQKQNGFIPFKVGWQSTPKRTEEWKKKKIEEIGQEEFNQEYNCEFLGSTDSLLNTETLKSLEFTDPVKTDMGGEIKYYKLPIPGHLYITIVDTAEGLGADYSVVNIFDVTLDNPLKQIEQVCMFRSNMIDQTMLAHVAGRISQEYNNSLCVVENNFGSETAVQLLNEVEYENLYMDDKGVGIRMTARVKRIGVERLKEMITGGLLKVNAIEYLEEFANFIRIKSSYGSDKGYNDDLVMTTVLFAYFTKTDYYKDYAKGDAYREMHKEKIDKLMRADDAPTIYSVGDDGKVTSTADKDWW